jgi:hypothetical protein
LQARLEHRGNLLSASRWGNRLVSEELLRKCGSPAKLGDDSAFPFTR